MFTYTYIVGDIYRYIVNTTFCVPFLEEPYEMNNGLHASVRQHRHTDRQTHIHLSMYINRYNKDTQFNFR